MNNQYTNHNMCHGNGSMYPVPLQSTNYTYGQMMSCDENCMREAMMPAVGNYTDNMMMYSSGSRMSEIPPNQLTPDIPKSLSSTLYNAGYLRTQIGKVMQVEFLIGTSLNKRVGRLLDVGASYIILQSAENDSVIMCDLYSIKFATIVSNPEECSCE